jgi:hypothetical protein
MDENRHEFGSIFVQQVLSLLHPSIIYLISNIAMPRAAHLRTYGDRAEDASNPTAKLLLQTMERKKTNLAVSVDVTTSSDFLLIIEAVGPYVCLIKAKTLCHLSKTLS